MGSLSFPHPRLFSYLNIPYAKPLIELRGWRSGKNIQTRIASSCSMNSLKTSYDLPILNEQNILVKILYFIFISVFISSLFIITVCDGFFVYEIVSFANEMLDGQRRALDTG